MADILFKTDKWAFSCRVSGICVENGKVLLQTTTGCNRSFAFPGGNAAFGETNKETLIREFQEEIGTQIMAGNLKWVAEAFFPLGKKVLPSNLPLLSGGDSTPADPPGWWLSGKGASARPEL